MSRVKPSEFDTHLAGGNLIQTSDQKELALREAYVHPGLVAMINKVKEGDKEERRLCFMYAQRASASEISHRLIVQFGYDEKEAKRVGALLVHLRDPRLKSLRTLGKNVWDMYLKHILNTGNEYDQGIVDGRCRRGEPRVVGDPVVPGDPIVFKPDGSALYGSRLVIW